MEYRPSILEKEAAVHGLYIAQSKFKNAGMGLFAAKGILLCHQQDNR
jgi:hypothetical protein